MLFWISFSLLVVTLLCALAMIGAWVYFDAKEGCGSPLLWALIAMFTPSLFGVLIYFLVGRKGGKVIKNKFRTPLIFFTTSFIVSICLFIGSCMASDRLPVVDGVSIGMVNNNIGNGWSLSFKSSGEKFSRTVNLNQDQIKSFTIEGKSEKGKVYLLVLQNDLAKVVDISNLAESHIELSGYLPGKIELIMYNDNAKNVKVKMHWGK